MTEPTVCVPSAPGTMPAATAAAEPEEEPPGVCSRLRGLCVLPGVKVASSVVTVLPMMTAPARRSAVTQAASAMGCRPLWARQPFSVGMSDSIDDVLDADGNPMQRADALALLAQAIGGPCLLERALAVEEGPGLHLRLEGGDAVEAGADQLLRARLAAGNPRSRRGHGQVGEVRIGQWRPSVDSRRPPRWVACLSRRRDSSAARASCRARGT